MTAFRWMQLPSARKPVTSSFWSERRASLSSAWRSARFPRATFPGEMASPTQPFPRLPAALVPQALPASQAFGMTEEDRQWCADTLGRLRNEGVFTPPSLQGSIAIPGNIGGLAWGGVAFDPEHHLLIVPNNRLVAYLQLIPRQEFNTGKREDGFEYGAQAGTPYAVRRRFLLAPKGSPCSAPPYGALTAIDLSTGQRKWEVTTGYLPWLPDDPHRAEYGSPSLGSAIVTGGGLVFMGGTFDSHLRAYDVETGEATLDGRLTLERARGRQ